MAWRNHIGTSGTTGHVTRRRGIAAGENMKDTASAGLLSAGHISSLHGDVNISLFLQRVSAGKRDTIAHGTLCETITHLHNLGYGRITRLIEPLLRGRTCRTLGTDL